MLFSTAPEPRDLEAVAGSVVFSMYDLAYGRELWRASDPAGGGALLKDLRPGGDGSDPQRLTALGNVAYFTADDGVHGRELWRTDGTDAGTTLAADLTPGPNGSAFAESFVADGVLYWRVAGQPGNPDFDYYFRAPAAAGEPTPPGAAPGTVSLVQGWRTSIDWIRMPKLNGVGYFIRDGRLWSATGPGGAGETMVVDPDGGAFPGGPGRFQNEITVAGSKLFLRRGVAGDSLPLFVSDGTASGTRQVAAAPATRNLPMLAAPDGRVYFGVLNAAAEPSKRGELWATDGTDAGMFLVAAFADQVVGGLPTSPHPFAYENGRVYVVTEGSGVAVADPAARTAQALGGYRLGDPRNPDVAFLNGRLFTTTADGVAAVRTDPSQPPPPSVSVGASTTVFDGEPATLRADVQAIGRDVSQFAVTWDFDGDGAFDDATGKEVTLPPAEVARLTASGPLRFRARADDGQGAAAESRTGELTLTPKAPDATHEAPHAYAQGAEIEFALTYTDASGIDPASLIDNDAAVEVRIDSGTTFQLLPARYVSIDATTPGPARTAVYRATLPAAPAQGTIQQVTISMTAAGVRDVLGNGYGGNMPLPGIYVYPLPADLANPPPGVPKNVQGKLLNVFTSNGKEASTPIALRRVYADANGNAAFDAGEQSVVTDFDGSYAFFAPPGATLRAEMAEGWAGAGGGDGSSPIHLRMNDTDLRLSPAAPSVVDVLVAFGGVTGNGPGFNDWASIRQRVADLVAGANRPFGNSDTHTVINLVGVLPVWYASTGAAPKDLARLVKDGDGPIDEVHRERDRVGADVVVLIPSEADRPRRDNVLGIARQLGKTAGEPEAAFAFVTNANDPNLLAHELGHVLGAGHERRIEKRGITPYAHGFVGVDGAGQPFKTVMAYGSSRNPEGSLPFFSNPRLTYNGVPMGDAATADNARTIRQFAPVVAGYRQPPPGGPAGSPVAVDLTVAVDFRPPRRTRPGSTLSVGVTLTNAGGATAFGDVGANVLLSTDAVLDAADTYLGNVSSPVTLKAGAVKRLRGRFKLPASLAPGTYCVLAQGGGGPPSGEPNTANNVATGPTVTVSA